MTHTRQDIEPGGVSELGHKSLTVESMIAFCCSWVWFCFVFLHTAELQVSVNSGRCWLEGMVLGDWMSLGRGVGGDTEMHCLLIITQSSLVPSPDYDCADAQRPDSAHPFPEG